jgi:hypothetical protein
MMQFASINMFYAWRKNDIHEEQIHPSGYIKSHSEPPSKKMSRFEPYKCHGKLVTVLVVLAFNNLKPGTWWLYLK